ncbi:MAG: hypothetical protein FWD69_08045 [Polyangiaceae bacterium]|nr:hypothetical protein [Polyangiaceae bacterium]
MNSRTHLWLRLAAVAILAVLFLLPRSPRRAERTAARATHDRSFMTSASAAMREVGSATRVENPAALGRALAPESRATPEVVPNEPTTTDATN